MSMILYYAGHTFKNQLKKLFKTWIAVFIAVCFLLGAGIGIGAAKLSEAAEKHDTVENGIEVTDNFENKSDINSRDIENVYAIIELIIGGVVLLFLIYSLLFGEKSGSSIFMMADVNLLFASPLKPQSVLLFRLLMQMGAIFATSIYLVFQIPNLVLNLGLGTVSAIAMLLAWILILVIGKLLSVLIYSLASTHDGFRKIIRPIAYAVIIVLVAVYYIFWRSSGLAPFPAVLDFFNGQRTWYIPIWGWIKGFVMQAIYGNIVSSIIFLSLIVLAYAVLIYVIWSINVDFYEDALIHSCETAEKLEASMSENKAIKKRKKDRSDSVLRDGLNKGQGASIYYYKSLYNRKRFAKYGVFTKTLITYLLIGIGGSLFMKLIIKNESFLPVALVLAGVVFYRSLGNPIAEDTKQDSFVLVPDTAFRKLYYSLLAGNTNCILDLLPGYIVAAVSLHAKIPLAVVALILILSIDLYSSVVGIFIDLSVPTGQAKLIKTLIQIIFIYFGLIPIAGILAVGIVIEKTLLFMILAIIFDLFISALFFLLIPNYITNGKK